MAVIPSLSQARFPPPTPPRLEETATAIQNRAPDPGRSPSFLFGGFIACRHQQSETLCVKWSVPDRSPTCRCGAPCRPRRKEHPGSAAAHHREHAAFMWTHHISSSQHNGREKVNYCSHFALFRLLFVLSVASGERTKPIHAHCT